MRKTPPTNPLQVVFEKETDGRWIAEIPKLPGVLSYGKTKLEAKRRVSAIALRTLADLLEQGKRIGPANSAIRLWGGQPLRHRVYYEHSSTRAGVIRRQRGSHRMLRKHGFPDVTFAFHESEEIGPRMLARIAKRTGLRPEDL